MSEGKRQIFQQFVQEYDIKTVKDIQDTLKDLLGDSIKGMMEAEMDSHLGYKKSERSDSDDYRNGYKTKQFNSSLGSMEIEVPQDRKYTLEPLYTLQTPIESLNAIYRKLNRQRSVFPSGNPLLKSFYLSAFEATKKWTKPIRNSGKIYGELAIMYEGRMSE